MTRLTTRPDYRVHKAGKVTTVFIEGNGIYGHYMVHDGKDVSKIVEHYDGDEMVLPFHTIGELPTNIEAMLLNELAEDGEL